MALTIPRKVESDALLALLSTCYPWKLCSKFKPKQWADVARADKPALYLIMPREKKDARGVGIQRRVRCYQAWIYLRADAAEDPTAPIGDMVDDILDALDLAFQTLNPDGTVKFPGPGAPQKLMWPLDNSAMTELVTEAWIEGEILINPGIPDAQSISILVPIMTRTGNP